MSPSTSPAASNVDTSTSSTQNASSEIVNPKGLPLFALTALVIGSMIGGGIFGLPSQMARAAAPIPLILGWIITGVGMLMLAFSFQSLARRRPDIDGGVYGYAKAGFGNYIGFCSAWGYWIGAWIGNVGFLVLLMSSVGTFIPAFEGGNTVPAVVCASIVLWIVHFLVLRGVHEAAFVNVIVTIAKIVPLVIFVVMGFVAFKIGLFTQDLWGVNLTIEAHGLGSTLTQIKAMMLITVWVFSGIEGASIFSQRARKRADVGKATVFGFLGVLVLYILINLLAYGIVSQAKLAGIADPSLAGVFALVVGSWGAKFISIGLMISLLGVLLSWILLCTEILRIPAKEGVIPKAIGRLNSHGTPPVALWMSNICVQIMLIWTLFSAKTYEFLILLASGTILIPYLWVALFQVTSCFRKDNTDDGTSRGRNLTIGILATIYSLWLIYAGGPIYLLLGMSAYFLGTVLYVWARKEVKGRIFAPAEWAVFAVLGAGLVCAIVLTVLGRFTL